MYKKMSKGEFKKSLKTYARMNTRESLVITKRDVFPILNDIGDSAGIIDSHYFLQDILVANMIFKAAPKMHYDIGSRVDGFISHLLSFDQEVTLFDIRPLNINVSGLHFIKTDATFLTEIEDESLESISSLHAVEHFGLGRYGDEVDPEACFKAMHAIKRKLKPGGYLYFSVPIGATEKVCFNAHRIFTPETITKEFLGLELIKLMVIQNNTVKEYPEIDKSIALGDYDCGIFVFKKEKNR